MLLMQNPCGAGTCMDDWGQGLQTGPLTLIPCTSLLPPASFSRKPETVCMLLMQNPCGAGTCMDDGVGGYNCTCPANYTSTARPDGSATCIPRTSGFEAPQTRHTWPPAFPVHLVSRGLQTEHARPPAFTMRNLSPFPLRFICVRQQLNSLLYPC
ncbi:unnamed protein product [Closterium sp. NIES-54]